MSDEKMNIPPATAIKILPWLERGPVALYRSVNLSNPGMTWLVPAGQGKPSWEAANEPERLLTIEDFVVTKYVEVKRFHVSVRMGQQGWVIKVSDRDSVRIRRCVLRAGDGAYHVFDYTTQEAVIMKPDGRPIPLAEWKP